MLHKAAGETLLTIEQTKGEGRKEGKSQIGTNNGVSYSVMFPLVVAEGSFRYELCYSAAGLRRSLF